MKLLIASVTRARKASSEATAKAPVMLNSLQRISTCSGMVLVSPRIWPETTDTAPNSPMARALQRITPYSRPHLMLGRVTCQKVRQPEAPSTRAASSSSLPCACISGISSRATNGKVTKTVASTMPGTAKRILMSCSRSQGPKQPCRPNSSTQIRPEITGETENGRSIRVSNRFLPRNSNLAIAHAAATPKTRFSGTAMAAVSRVSLMADQASASVIDATQTSQPLRSASQNTATSGTNRNRVRNTSATPISDARTQAGSPVAPGVSGGSPRAMAWLAAVLSTEEGAPLMSVPLCPAALAGPGLQQVDGQQQHEGHDQHHHGNGRGAGIVVLLQLGDDEQRRDLGDHRHVAGDEDHRAVFARGAREGQRKPGQQGRQDGREDHAGEGLPAAGAEAGGSFFELALGLFQHRLHGTHHEGQADEGQRHQHAQGREGDLDAQGREQLAQPAVLRIQRGQRDAGHRRGQSKRQVHQGIDDALAGEAVAHQHPGHDAAEDDIEEGADQRGTEAEPVGGHHARRGHRLHEALPGQGEGLEEDRRQRDQHDQRQVENGEAQ
eukprot:TRINITY_DN1187_c2_g1_i1.p1 TRINITY_DN1187_c2_g1~~TRINITY_DN1187_c2_g1_i1.p1  ORF type:complete len:554 (-),score=206.99 TRINITY_DN1187_c2_g1_i1:2173-3834(-)